MARLLPCTDPAEGQAHTRTHLRARACVQTDSRTGPLGSWQGPSGTGPEVCSGPAPPHSPPSGGKVTGCGGERSQVRGRTSRLLATPAPCHPPSCSASSVRLALAYCSPSMNQLLLAAVPLSSTDRSALPRLGAGKGAPEQCPVSSPRGAAVLPVLPRGLPPGSGQRCSSPHGHKMSLLLAGQAPLPQPRIPMPCPALAHLGFTCIATVGHTLMARRS